MNGRETAQQNAEIARWVRVGEAARARGTTEDRSTLAELAESLGYYARDGEYMAQRGYELPPGFIRLVRVTIEHAMPLAVGDMLVDRRGYGGAVERIVPDKDMPRRGSESIDVIFPGAGDADIPEGTRREARLALAGRLLEERWVGRSPSDEDIERCWKRAEVPESLTTASLGALYLLRLAPPKATKAR